MKRYIIFLILFFTCFSILISAENDANKKRWGKWLKHAQSNMTKIIFYGKVVDQYGHPVSDAVIYLRTRVPRIVPMPDSKTEVKSDLNGLFEYKGSKGGSLYFDKIIKKGYVAQWPFPAFNYSKDRNPFHTPDPKKPIIFHMRKKGANPTFLITEQYYNIEIEPDSSNLYSFLDLEADWENAGDNRDYKKDFLPKHYDIKVTSVFDKEKFDWIVTFTASGDNGGFILSDEFLSEAPEKGYKKEFKFIQHVLTEKEEDILSETEDRKVEEKYMKLREFILKNKYLYIKSREPAIYTRMKLKDASIDVEWVNVSTSIATNPFGERNLEFNDELPYDITEKCEESVTEAFLKGKLPKKPNIKKMMTEFKKTHKRVKNKSGDYRWIEK